MGIAPDRLQELFKSFVQVDPRRDAEKQGSGLGLAIVKGLVEAMGGTVDATSAPGEGTCVRFWLPLAGEMSPRR